MEVAHCKKGTKLDIDTDNEANIGCKTCNTLSVKLTTKNGAVEAIALSSSRPSCTSVMLLYADPALTLHETHCSANTICSRMEGKMCDGSYFTILHSC